MQRKPGFPIGNCNIKMADSMPMTSGESGNCEDGDQQQIRQMLINFGHSQWGFNNWSWSVTKQDLDFVDFTNGKYYAGVVAFVSVTVKTVDIHRENIGYATTSSPMKGSAIYQARKGAVTNALRETLLSFGGVVATDLLELLEHRIDNPAPLDLPENNQNFPKMSEPKNSPLKNIRKDSTDSSSSSNIRPPIPVVQPKNIPPPPIAKACPMPVNLPPANRPVLPNPRPPPAQIRPNSNVSFVLQPVMPPLYGPPLRMPHVGPPIFPNAYYEYGPWHFTYESYDRHHHGNVNLNFNIPPKNLVVNSRPSVECKNACVRDEPGAYCPPPQNQGCWIKPTIFYDGFWTEQKVKKWVAEQVEKQFPDDGQKLASPVDTPSSKSQ